jgi:hypothetical protein
MSSNVRGILVSGAAAALAVTAVAAVRGTAEHRSAWSPINAVSHILWGDPAAERRGFTLRESVAGLVLNGVACGFWAWVYQRGRRSMRRSDSLFAALVSGTATSALAYITDYHLVPRRVTPGFELSLSRRSFPWLYGALAVGLCAPDALASGRSAGRNL